MLFIPYFRYIRIKIYFYPLFTVIYYKFLLLFFTNCFNFIIKHREDNINLVVGIVIYEIITSLNCFSPSSLFRVAEYAS